MSLVTSRKLAGSHWKIGIINFIIQVSSKQWIFLKRKKKEKEIEAPLEQSLCQLVVLEHPVEVDNKHEHKKEMSKTISK